MSIATLAAAVLAGSFAAGTTAASARGIEKIQHVVMIMQENRSFDSYFGTYPGANGIPGGVCVPDPLKGGCVKPFHDPADKNVGGPHGTEASLNDIDGGKMDGFVGQAEKGLDCSSTNPSCSPCKEAEAQSCVDVMGYHDAREIPNYWSYAHNYVLQDNMYAAAASWSLTEHLYAVSAWSAVCPGGGTNPLECAGSLEPQKPGLSWTGPIVPGKASYPWTDLTYLLAKANVSWRYYVFEGAEPDCESDEAVTCTAVRQGPQTPGIWNPLADFIDVREDRQLENIQSLNSFFTAAHDQSGCRLPNVSWIDPSINVSEHPPAVVSEGQAYVTTLINTIMRSPCWSSTAIFVSWDEWGGFYDHVVPPAVDQNGYGIRVPGLVISPYAKAGYIDHQQLSHDSYLKFIEDDFLSGARLNPATDGRPDARANVREEAGGLGDLASDFNFEQAPRQPMLLSTHPAPGPASEPPGSRPSPPTATTGPASVGQSSATLNATVNPDGSAVTDCHFEYGVSPSYGVAVPCSAPAAGTSPVSVSVQLGGLAPGTIYHFRIVAVGPGGPAYGADQVLSTLATPPPSRPPSEGPTASGEGTQATAPGHGASQAPAIVTPALQAALAPINAPVFAPVPFPGVALAGTLAAVNSAGTVGVRLSCPLRGSSCTGTITLSTLNRGAARRTLAAGSFSIAGGRVRTVKLRLSPRGRTLLRRVRVLRARMTAVSRDGAGTAHTTRAIVSLRRT